MAQPESNTRWEEIKVTGDQLVATVKELVREGNIRRIVIKNEEGHVYLEIPLTVGVVGAARATRRAIRPATTGRDGGQATRPRPNASRSLTRPLCSTARE
jgi:hypothetical protein